jgi:hypothetical protein
MDDGIGRVPHFSRSLREVGLFADTLPTLNQRSVEFSPPTQAQWLIRINPASL